MSKFATVKALSDSAPPPTQLRTVIEVQQQFEKLRETLLRWTEGMTSLQASSRQQMLDLAVLIEPIVPALAHIHQKQQQQDERQAKLDERLAKLEAGMSRVTAALPSPVSKDGRQMQPPLASKKDLLDLPSKVWEAKPGIFGKS